MDISILPIGACDLLAPHMLYRTVQQNGASGCRNPFAKIYIGTGHDQLCHAIKGAAPSNTVTGNEAQEQYPAYSALWAAAYPSLTAH
jgi:hypothetical protein